MDPLAEVLSPLPLNRVLAQVAADVPLEWVPAQAPVPLNRVIAQRRVPLDPGPVPLHPLVAPPPEALSKAAVERPGQAARPRERRGQTEPRLERPGHRLN